MAITYPYQMQSEPERQELDTFGNPRPALGNPPALSGPVIQRDMQPEYNQQRTQAQPPMMDPRRALWGGLIMDIGNFIGSKGRVPMQGLGPRMMMQAEQQNYERQQYAQASAEDRRRWEAERARDLIGDPATDPSSVREWRYYNALSDEEKAEYLRMKRANPNIVDRQGLGIGYTHPVTGEWISLVDESGVAEAGGGRKGAETAAAQAEQMRPNLINTLTTTAPLIDELSGFLSSIETDGWRGGPIRGTVMKYFDSELARMNILNTYQTLAQLGVQNLAPVSNFEINLLSQMFADPDMTDAQITAALELTRDKMRHNQRMAQEQLDFIDENGDLRGYRPSSSAPSGSIRDIMGGAATPTTTQDEEERLLTEY